MLMFVLDQNDLLEEEPSRRDGETNFLNLVLIETFLFFFKKKSLNFSRLQQLFHVVPYRTEARQYLI